MRRWWWLGLAVVMLVLTGGEAWPIIVGLPLLVTVVGFGWVVSTVLRGPGVGSPEISVIGREELPAEVADLLDPLVEHARTRGWEPAEVFRFRTEDSVVMWGVAGPFDGLPCSGLLGVGIAPNLPPQLLIEVSSLGSDGVERATNAPDRHTEASDGVEVVSLDGDLDDVLRVHLARLGAVDVEWRHEDPIEVSTTRSHERMRASMRRRGWIREDGRYSVRGAVVLVLRLLPPWKTVLERRRRGTADRWLAAA